VQAGTLEMELHPFRTQTDLREAHELDSKFLERSQEANAPPFRCTTNTFALVAGGEKAARRARDADRQRRGVRRTARRGVEGHVGRVIDAKDVAGADAVLAPVRASSARSTRRRGGGALRWSSSRAEARRCAPRETSARESEGAFREGAGAPDSAAGPPQSRRPGSGIE
jgi:hypothetical protein